MKLFILALIPAVCSAAAFVLVRKTGFGRISKAWQQVIIGLIFGAVAVFEMNMGIKIEGFVVSARDAVPVCAGLIFGGPAGIITGVFVSVERCLKMIFVTGLSMKGLSSTISIVCAGVLAAAARKFMFEDRRATAMSGFVIASIAMIIHFGILLLLHNRDLELAYKFIATYSFIVVMCNGAAGALGIIAVRMINHERIFGEERKGDYIARLRRLMLATIAFAMVVSLALTLMTSTYTMEARISDPAIQKVVYKMNIADAYLDMYFEFVVLALLYAFMYVIMRKTISRNMAVINDKLKKVIGSGISEMTDDDYMNEMVSVEKNFKMFSEYIAEKIDDEMKLARNIQMSAMPDAFKAVSELSICASVEPAREVGGDFYDYFAIDDEHVAVLISDVSGKGIGAAMFMMKAKSVIKKLAREGLEIDEIFNEANRQLHDRKGEGLFVTVWMGIINLVTGSVDYADAGHGCPLLKLPGRGFEYVESEPELVLGAFPDKTYKIQHLQMIPGSRLFLFTDGVTEANNADEDMYGEERLQKVLNEECEGQKGANVLTAVKENLDEFTGEAGQFDDITMLIADYMGSMEDSERDSRTFAASNENLEEAENFIRSMLSKAGCGSVNEMQITVAFEELFTNIAYYAYPGSEGKVTVNVQIKQGVCQIELFDRGIPFNPLEKEAPDLTLPAGKRQLGGLGIVMTIDIMDYVNYERRGDMNVFTMKKILD